MRFLNDIKRYEKGNIKFLNILNYYLVKKDLVAVKYLLLNIGQFTKDGYFIRRYNLTDNFLNTAYAKDLFGIAEDIVNTMKNMTFSGNVNITVPNETDQKIIESILFSNHFHEIVKDVYKNAVTAYNHKGYLLMFVKKEYEITDENEIISVNNKFLEFKSVPSHECHYEDGVFVWTFYKDLEVFDGKKSELHSIEVNYEYKKVDNKYTLDIKACNFDSKQEIREEEIKKLLGIDVLHEEYDFTPYFVLDVIDSMLPNIFNIEINLSKALYFQDEDLSNSQTMTYTPENMLFAVTGTDQDYTKEFNDRYKTSKIVRGGQLDAQKIETVEGKSSIDFIERNIAMNVLRACIDAKISPSSLQYSIIDKMGNNTEVGETRERASIRLRENHINILKNFISLVISTYLKVHGKTVKQEKVTVIFDPYITPSIETTVNVLSKAVQFGIMSREQAVKRLNKNELSEEEIKLEIERIKEFTTQQDFNAEQQVKAGSDNTKEDKEKDTTKLKVDNNLKSSGIEE